MTGYRKLLLALLILFPLYGGMSAAADMFEIEAGFYENGTVTVRDINTGNGTIYELPDGGYQLILLDRDGNSVHATTFPVDFDAQVGLHSYAIQNGSETRYLLKVFHVPYTAGAETARFTRDEETIGTIDLSAHICTSDNRCPAYCTMHGRNDPDCSTGDTDGGLPVVPIAIVLGIILLGAVLYFSVEPG